MSSIQHQPLVLAQQVTYLQGRTRSTSPAL